jgi:ferric-dicitrate binding protein FerR (iron transport regulator)
MEHIYTILPKYFNKQSTAEENKLIGDWKKENPAEFKEHKAIWKLTENVEYIEFDSKASWNELQPSLSNTSSQTKKETKVIGIALWKKIMVAAVFVIVALFGVSQFNNQNIGSESDLFAEGLNIEFTEGTRGVSLLAEADVVETSLENGDKIWLNKGAEVEDMGSKDGVYNVKVRKGEAFFDVNSRKDKATPLFVHTSNAAVAVVGTQFTVTSRKEQTIIRVVEGVVEVMASDINKVEVKVGEQAIISKGNINKIKEFSPNFLAWKTGVFKFEGTSIRKIALLLQTYYDVEIEVAKGTTGTPSGEFPVMDVENLLKSLSLASGLKLEVVKANKKYKISNQ